MSPTTDPNPHRPVEGMSYGQHFTLDAWFILEDGTVDPEAARLHNDPEYIARVLNDAVEVVGMHILKPADVLHVPLEPEKKDTGEDCGGVTGTVILTTSHGSAHTWPLRGQSSWDLFSCKPFDAEKLLDYLTDRMRLSGGMARNTPRTHSMNHTRSFVLAQVQPRVMP